MLLHALPDGGLICVSQPAHALISGQLARAWGAPGFAAADPREPVILACEQHDVAWMGWEAAPAFDSKTGRPQEFRTVGGRYHAPMWAAGVALARASWGLWPALLISRHGNLIYRRFLDRHRIDATDAAAAEAYLREQGALQAAWAGLLGATQAQLAAGSALLGAVDQMSLTLCWGLADAGGVWAGDAPLDGGGTLPLTFSSILEGEVICDPWPFTAAEVTVATEAIHLAAPAVFSDSAMMSAALAAAPRIMLRARLVPRPAT